jgi:hypothetical protein
VIDIHVLTLPDRADKLERCVASLRHPAVSVHVVEGVDGDIGAGRQQGYAAGTAPWVAYVDDDDWMEPGAFDVLAPMLDEDWTLLQVGFVLEFPEGPRFLRDREGSFRIRANTRVMDHFCVYRREPHAALLGLYDGMRKGGDMRVRAEFAKLYPDAKVLRVNQPLYHWSRP